MSLCGVQLSDLRSRDSLFRLGHGLDRHTHRYADLHSRRRGARRRRLQGWSRHGKLAEVVDLAVCDHKAPIVDEAVAEVADCLDLACRFDVGSCHGFHKSAVHSSANRRSLEARKEVVDQRCKGVGCSRDLLCQTGGCFCWLSILAIAIASICWLFELTKASWRRGPRKVTDPDLFFFQ